MDQYEQALQIDPKLAAAHHGIGLILAENRRLDEAIVRFQKAIKVAPTYALAYAGLGEALLIQGRLSESLAATSRYVELVPKDDRGHALAEWCLQCCKMLIALDGRLSAVLQGNDKPANASEGLQFALLCRHKKLYAAAARFAAEAFTRAPSFAEDLRTRQRYNAACAAAQAGNSRGDDAVTISVAERACWRQQAARMAPSRSVRVDQEAGQRCSSRSCLGAESIDALAGRSRPGWATRTECASSLVCGRTKRMSRTVDRSWCRTKRTQKTK